MWSRLTGSSTQQCDLVHALECVHILQNSAFIWLAVAADLSKAANLLKRAFGFDLKRRNYKLQFATTLDTKSTDITEQTDLGIRVARARNILFDADFCEGLQAGQMCRARGRLGANEERKDDFEKKMLCRKSMLQSLQKPLANVVAVQTLTLIQAPRVVEINCQKHTHIQFLAPLGLEYIF